MNRQEIASVVMISVMVCGMTASVMAADTSPSAMQKPSASSTKASAPSTPVASGTIAAIDLQSALPTVKLTAADGTSLALAIDPKSSTAWQGHELIKLSDLKVGQQAKVTYVTKEGKDVVTTIQLATIAPTASKPSAPATPASTSY